MEGGCLPFCVRGFISRRSDAVLSQLYAPYAARLIGLIAKSLRCFVGKTVFRGGYLRLCLLRGVLCKRLQPYDSCHSYHTTVVVKCDDQPEQPSYHRLVVTMVDTGYASWPTSFHQCSRSLLR